MARKRKDNEKWRSRPSRKKKRKNRNSKPSKLVKNNSKLSKSTKPSRQKRKQNSKKDELIPNVSLEERLNEEVLDATITHSLLSERYCKVESNLSYIDVYKY